MAIICTLEVKKSKLYVHRTLDLHTDEIVQALIHFLSIVFAIT